MPYHGPIYIAIELLGDEREERGWELHSKQWFFAGYSGIVGLGRYANKVTVVDLKKIHTK